MPATIVVDGMGGDHFPQVPVEAALEVCRERPDITVILVGIESELLASFPKGSKKPPNLIIEHAPEYIRMDESPSIAVRKKPQSSLHRGIEILKEGRADAFFSTGNTGAIVAAGYFVSGLALGIHRPALSIIYPALNKRKVVLLDLGATVDPKAEHLAQFAAMGAAFSSATGVSNPEVRMLSVGEENIKGKPLVLEAADMMRSMVNYKGFIEGNQLFKNPEADVVVTDGFTGNIALKIIEGLSETIYGLIKERIAPHRRWIKLSSFLFKHYFASTFSRFNYTLYGSAVLLGLNHFVGIGHGRSNVAAFKTGILTLAQYAENNFAATFKKELEKGLEKGAKKATGNS